MHSLTPPNAIPAPQDRRMLHGALTCCMVAALTACGGGDGSSDTVPEPAESAESAPAGAGGANDPCALVTSAEAEQLLQGQVETERPGEANNEYLATCRYVTPRGGSLAVLVVKVSRKDGPTGFQNARRMEEEGFAIQPVAGVGDEAFWVGDPLHTLFVLQDTFYFDIGGDVQLEQVRPLAVTALARIR